MPNGDYTYAMNLENTAEGIQRHESGNVLKDSHSAPDLFGCPHGGAARRMDWIVANTRHSCQCTVQIVVE
ncbi:MAG: hypothetical protein ACK55I_23770, partial [bacterium]